MSNSIYSTALKYLGLSEKEEIKKLCARGFVPPPSLLKTVFELENIPDKNEQEKYTKIYQKNCKELISKYLEKIYKKKFYEQCLDKSRELYKKFIRSKFVWRGSSDNKFKQFVETMINSAYFGITNTCLNWSQWLLLTDEGQHLINLILNGNKTQKIYALATLQVYIVQIYIASGYDDIIFRKEFFNMLPAITPIIEDNPLLNKAILLFLEKGYGYIFLNVLKNIMIDNYNVPSKFFTNFSIISPDETILIGEEKQQK